MKKRIKMKKLKGKTVTCEYCNGHGQYEDSYDDMYGNNYSLGFLYCESCEGKGFIDALKSFKTDIKINKRIKKIFG